MKPLYGYDSQENSFVCNNYPYGGMRCRIRYWLESDKKRGWRFCSQTENPKTLRWNAPRKSTYSLLAECMLLDDAGHVRAAGLTEYSTPVEVAEFIRSYPEANFQAVKVFGKMKCAYLKRLIATRAVWTVTVQGRTDEVSEQERDAEVERNTERLRQWEECLQLLTFETDVSNKIES